MKNSVVSLAAVLILFGCSAAGLQKAEQETSLVALANPLGEVIHFPLLVASTVANAATKPEFVVEKREPWRPGLPGEISEEEYAALSDEEYLSLIAKARGAERRATRPVRKVGNFSGMNEEVGEQGVLEQTGSRELQQPIFPSGSEAARTQLKRGMELKKAAMN